MIPNPIIPPDPRLPPGEDTVVAHGQPTRRDEVRQIIRGVFEGPSRAGVVITDEMVERARKAFVADVCQQDPAWTDEAGEDGEELLTSPEGDYFALDTALFAALAAALQVQP